MTKDSNMPSNRQGATAPMEKRDGIETRSQLETCSHAVGQGVGLAAASLISYALITHILTRLLGIPRGRPCWRDVGRCRYGLCLS